MGPSDGERFRRGATSSRLLHLIPSHRPSPGRRSSIAWSCRLLGAFIRLPCLPCGERSTNSRVPWLRRHYPPSPLLRTHPPPSRRPPTFRRTPGYRTYPASAAFATGRGRLLQLLDLFCVTVLSLPPRRSVLRHRSECRRSCCLRPGPKGSAFGSYSSRGHWWVHLRYGPVTRSPSRRWLCQLASSDSFPPRRQLKLRGF